MDLRLRSSQNMELGIEILGIFGDKEKPHITIFSSGYMLKRAIDSAEQIAQQGFCVKVFDIWRLKPLNTKALARFVEESRLVVTIEEQYLDGAFGSAVLEALSDEGLLVPSFRLGLKKAYIFENGSRDQLVDGCGLSRDSISNQIIDKYESLGRRDG